MSIFYKFWRVIQIIVLYLQILIFVGVFLQGFIDIMSPIIFIDYIYALLYIFLGIVTNAIFFTELKILHRKPIPEKLLRKWHQSLPKIIIVTILFIIIYIFRYEISSLIAFIGYEIGRFFIRAASSAYLRIFGLNLDLINFYLVAWVFQWHFIWAFISLAEAIGRSVFNMFHKKV